MPLLCMPLLLAMILRSPSVPSLEAAIQPPLLGEGVWRKLIPDWSDMGTGLSASQNAALYASAARMLPTLRELLPPGQGFDLSPQRTIWGKVDPDSHSIPFGMLVRMFDYLHGKPGEEGVSMRLYANNVREVIGDPCYHGVQTGTTLWVLPKQLSTSHGCPVFAGTWNGFTNVLVTPEGVEPFKSVTRRRAADLAGKLIRANMKKHPEPANQAYYQKTLDKLAQEVASMSSEELDQPAFLRTGGGFLDWKGFPKQGDRESVSPVVELNPALFNPKRPATTMRCLSIWVPTSALGNGPSVKWGRQQIDSFDWSKFRRYLGS